MRQTPRTAVYKRILIMPLTFGSLFAGIGGFDLGFEWAGMSCKWQVEIDDYANRVLAKHWPGVPRWRDVRTWPQPGTESVDVICGGFPCQDISNAGKRAGLDGDRSGLFFEIIRIACELEPRFIVLENVAALLNRGMGRVLGELAEIGFDTEWHCIPASAVGAPHVRDRVFLLAYTKSKRINRNMGNDSKEKKTNRKWPNQFNSFSENVANAESKRPQRRRPAKQQISNSWDEQIKLGRNCDSARTNNWAVEPAVGRVAHGISNRVDRLKCLGNAIVPQVAYLVGKRVIEINEIIESGEI
jgi:DNA (cytosine-5)-methyltransferase 1